MTRDSNLSWKLIAIAGWTLLSGIAGWNLHETIALGKEVVRVETRLDMTPLTKKSQSITVATVAERQ